MPPIAELAIPFDVFLKKGRGDLKNICTMALDETLKGLRIPDPDDRELKINVLPTGVAAKDLHISYTFGKDEYGQGKVFNPTKRMQKTCRSIFRAVKPEGINRVVLEGWKDTAFMIRDGEKMTDDVEIIVPDRFKNGINLQGSTTVRLALSQSMFEDGFNGSEGRYRDIAKQVLSLFGNGKVEIQRPDQADTDIGVEVDLSLENEKFSDEEMKYLMRKVESYINKNGLTGNMEKSATIWVRQGEPVTVVAE